MKRPVLLNGIWCAVVRFWVGQLRPALLPGTELRAVLPRHMNALIASSSSCHACTNLPPPPSVHFQTRALTRPLCLLARSLAWPVQQSVARRTRRPSRSAAAWQPGRLARANKERASGHIFLSARQLKQAKDTESSLKMGADHDLVVAMVCGVAQSPRER